MFQAILKFFRNLFSSPVLTAFEEWCAKVFTAEKALVLVQLKAFALDAALTAQQTGLDSDSKRKMAFQEISAKAQTAGVICGTSMIALALEMAVQSIKGDK